MDRNNRHSDEDNWRDRSENQRVGRDIYRDRGDRPANEQYRSGQSYRNEGDRDQTHYGTRPDSVYRNPNINFGDNQNRNYNENRGQENRYSQNRPQENRNWNQQPPMQRYGQDLSQPPREYHDHTRPEQHHDHRDYTERNWYKDTDYRYRSGNRGNWHAPGSGYLDNDHNYRPNEHNRNYSQNNQGNNNQRSDYRNNEHNDRHENEDFFDRMGRNLKDAWNNISHPDGYEDRNNPRRPPHNYEHPRGYDSGPRWADESETERWRRDSEYRRDRSEY